MKPLFDLSNNNNNNPNGYPLFLGSKLGIMDNVHVTYPQIAALRDKMISDNWKWDEISLHKDARDIQDPSLKAATDVMVKNLSFQYVADSVAQASIEILGMFCSNTEMEGLLKFWGYNELVHAMSYSEIIKNAFQDPNVLLEESKNFPELLERLGVVAQVFEDTRKLGYLYQLDMLSSTVTESDLRKQIFLFLGALTSLESISFATSFAATFAVGKSSQAFDGIIKIVQLVARDELETHVKADLTIFDILRKGGWEEEYQAVKPQIQVLFDTVIGNEQRWSKYLFSEGRRIVGLNESSIMEYTYHLSAPVYDRLGLNKGFTVPDENPLSWMKDYLDLDNIQIALQESQNNNYKVNSVVDDLGDDDLDF